MFSLCSVAPSRELLLTNQYCGKTLWFLRCVIRLMWIDNWIKSNNLYKQLISETVTMKLDSCDKIKKLLTPFDCNMMALSFGDSVKLMSNNFSVDGEWAIKFWSAQHRKAIKPDARILHTISTRILKFDPVVRTVLSKCERSFENWIAFGW